MKNKKIAKVKNSVLIIRIKQNAIKLRANYQLPYYLCYLIRQIDNDTPISIVKYLSMQCEHCMRLKGYYKKYPIIEKDIDDSLRKLYPDGLKSL